MLLDKSFNSSANYIRYKRNIVNGRRKLRQRRRIINKICNHANTLNQIKKLSFQNTNDPFASQIFNGTSFY